MWFLSRLRARRTLDAASAEALLAGRGVAPGAPADQQALARLLEVAAEPGSGPELDGEVAAAAMFVQVTSEARPHRTARRVLVVAACAVAVGGTAVYASVVPVPHHKMAPVPYGVPAGHRAAPDSTAARPSSRPPATSRRDAGLRSPPAGRSASRRRPRSGGGQ
jgi:hypothetical protein